MQTKTSLLSRIGAAELIALAVMVSALALPFFVSNAATVSLLTQIMIGVMGALSVYIMLRMDLMIFAVPAFMAIGGYTAAILSVRHDVTDVFLLVAASFGIPFLVAIPLGFLVLRMRGVYFVLVTFVLAEIMPLLLFETPRLTGGSNGIAGLPAVVAFGRPIEDSTSILFMCTALALLATAITVALTRVFRPQFESIRENELLGQSLGLLAWKYKIYGFCVSAGIAGLAGFALVEMLMTAHPSSFSALSSVNYVAYTIVGGQASILGPLVGAALLVWASNLFSLQGEVSQGLFGILLIVAVIFAKGGIVGVVEKLRPKPKASRLTAS
ncbi:branched-chain amino acid ABC transporter permease [Enterovirga rhinocerotis]|uniref:Branched-chain amino acid transport system permease protein n=1 Tax=Enterovirga rhinocerotis TaxID=1339210 RepID=A0A4R7C568_9HYPH|nr:branched-chain amino acid ABC transporter permease [Enterovirga rhinocerotis]TDR93301.1 branched-chain amino acid transport system permease protein [Enterovirga rhinocerotis]